MGFCPEIGSSSSGILAVAGFGVFEPFFDLEDVGVGNLAALVFALQDIEQEAQFQGRRRIQRDPAGLILGTAVKAPTARVMIGAVENDGAIVFGFLPFVGGQIGGSEMFCERMA